MHVYCDESGGIAPANPYFTMAAVVLDADYAVRALKAFRKAARLPKSVEVKGSSLKSPADRSLFFEILAKEGGVRGGAVVCARGRTIANWAIGAFQGREEILFRHMLFEAFEVLPLTSDARGITVDKGRYKQSILDSIKDKLVEDVMGLTGRRIPFGYGDSAAIAGLQIVDVLANTAGRISVADRHSTADSDALIPLQAQGCLQLCEARLPRLMPEWVTASEIA
jgi:hypothetical protein